MRIIAGEFKGRKLYTLPGKNTRPTTARNKESLFQIIGPFFENGGESLDLFGGSGALTIEAISRGIEKGVICDNSYEAYNIIKKNLALVKILDKIELYKATYDSTLQRVAANKRQFDLILLDPPFRMTCIDEIISFIAKEQLLKKDGIIMAEYYHENEVQKKFGDIYEYRLLDKGTSKISLYTR